MENTRDQQARPQSKTALVEQANLCLRSGSYSRALDLLRGAAAEFPDDAQLSELEKLALDGVKRKAEADHLITESQELFAQRKSAEAIQLLRKAYDLDQNNSLARAILANALVEHAQSIVETDWLEAETLANQALKVNPAHPTAKSIRDLVVERKKTSSVEDWVSQAHKLQSSGDLFKALAWVAEGLAVHPEDPKLQQIQDEIQRDQGARRRQARRRDLEDLRGMAREIDGAKDQAAKQALSERIQAVVARYWTDGEILSIANALLLRLGLIPKGSASPHGPGAPVIFHVPRTSPPKPSRAATSPAPPSPVLPSPPSRVPPSQAPPKPIASEKIPASNVPSEVPPSVVPLVEVPAAPPEEQLPPLQAATITTGILVPSEAPPSMVPPGEAPTAPPEEQRPPLQATTVTIGILVPIEAPPSVVPPGEASSEPPEAQLPTPEAATVPAPRSKGLRRVVPRGKVRIVPPEPELSPQQAATVFAGQPSAPAARIRSRFRRKQSAGPNFTKLVLVSVSAAIGLFAAIFFFARQEPTPPVTQTPATAPPSVSAPAVSAPATSAPATPAPAVSTPSVSAPEPTTAEPSQPALPLSSDTGAGKVTLENQQPGQSGHNLGTILVVTGQDNARVFLNGKLQRQLTQAGQLRLSNLEFRSYVVQVSKSGFQDPPQQEVRLRKGEQARLVFDLQPQPQPQPQFPPRLAALTIQGGVPGTTVFVDQTLVGTIQPDGTLSVPTVNPGDHTVELRKERFQPRQFKKHFVAGGAISLAAADAVLEAALGELRITFAPADAKVAIVKGQLLTMVSSGVPLNLAAGTYTLSARTADGFTRSSTLEVVAGQSRVLDLSLAPNGMSKWDDPGAWRHERDSFIHKGGDFVLYGVAPASGTFVFSVMLTRGHVLQWVLNYTDPKNYVLCQMDDNNFYRAVIRNGVKADEIKVPDKGDRKAFRTLHIRVGPTEIVHQIRHGDRWTLLDRWTQAGANPSLGKFGFYIPGDDEVALSSFVHYVDLNIR